MQLFIAADHKGFGLKARIIDYLGRAGHQIEDVGDATFSPEDDFPVFAAKAIHKIQLSTDKDPRAILLCGGGQGMAMAANRFRGIRAAVVWDEEEARLSRNDNDSNVIALPARLLEDKPEEAFQIIDTWLATPFAKSTRYIRRNQELDNL